jgi:hypothetical protein
VNPPAIEQRRLKTGWNALHQDESPFKASIIVARSPSADPIVLHANIVSVCAPGSPFALLAVGSDAIAG